MIALSVVILVTTRLFAYDFQVGNVYYTRTSPNTVKVVQKSDDYTASYSGIVNIPETVSYQGNVYQVTALGEKAFHWCKDVTTIKLPNSVLSIGERCFNGCFG